MLALALASVSIASGDLAEAIRPVIEREFERSRVPGLSLVVVHRGKTLLAAGYGVTDLESRDPATPQTVYKIASLSKPITAALVMLLAEEGKVRLDEPARAYLPELGEPFQAITLRHLLSHTSGLPDYAMNFAFLANLDEPRSHELILGWLNKRRPKSAPGSRFAYSNTNYYLLGALLERVSGKPYGALLEERIARPLGLGTVRLDEDADGLANRARGYRVGILGVRPTRDREAGWAFSAGGLTGSVEEYARFVLALEEGRLLKAESLEAMWSPAKLADGSEATYGLGWSVNVLRERRMISHTGAIAGFSSVVMRFAHFELTVVAAMNAMDPKRVTRIATGVAQAAVAELRKASGAKA